MQNAVANPQKTRLSWCRTNENLTGYGHCVFIAFTGAADMNNCNLEELKVKFFEEKRCHEKNCSFVDTLMCVNFSSLSPWHPLSWASWMYAWLTLQTLTFANFSSKPSYILFFFKQDLLQFFSLVYFSVYFFTIVFYKLFLQARIWQIWRTDSWGDINI